jgi:hypothetical protein
LVRRELGELHQLAKRAGYEVLDTLKEGVWLRGALSGVERLAATCIEERENQVEFRLLILWNLASSIDS